MLITRFRHVFLLGLIGLGMVGCAGPRRYLAKRGRDLGDCVHAEIGLGWPVAPFLFPDADGHGMGRPRRRRPLGLLLPKFYVRAKATDFLVISDGATTPVRTGWRGRYRHAGPDTPIATGCPILCPTHEENAGTAAHTRYYVLTERTYDGPEPGPGGRVAERFWMGINATLLVSFQLDLNPAELADFLVGWTTLDIVGDDDWQREPPAPPGR